MTRALIALCLTPAIAAAQGAKVTALTTQDLVGLDGKEGTMIAVEWGSEYRTCQVGKPAPS